MPLIPDQGEKKGRRGDRGKHMAQKKKEGRGVKRRRQKENREV